MPIRQPRRFDNRRPCSGSLSRILKPGIEPEAEMPAIRAGNRGRCARHSRLLLANLTEMGAANMYVVRLLLAASALSVPWPSFAQDWAEYVNMQDRFRMFGPGVPEIQEITYPSEYGAVFPARVYTYEDGPNHYSLTVVDYTDAQRIHSERTNKTSANDGVVYWSIDVLGSIAYAAWNIRRRGGDVTYDAFHYIQRVQGHQLQITNGDQSRTYAGIYLHEMRLYIVEATVPEGAFPPTIFQQSLELLDEQGNTFNYQYLHTPQLRIGGG